MSNLKCFPEPWIKELEQQLELTSQKVRFFEKVVDVLKNDYGVLASSFC